MCCQEIVWERQNVDFFGYKSPKNSTLSGVLATPTRNHDVKHQREILSCVGENTNIPSPSTAADWSLSRTAHYKQCKQKSHGICVLTHGHPLSRHTSMLPMVVYRCRDLCVNQSASTNVTHRYDYNGDRRNFLNVMQTFRNKGIITSPTPLRVSCTALSHYQHMRSSNLGNIEKLERDGAWGNLRLGDAYWGTSLHGYL